MIAMNYTYHNDHSTGPLHTLCCTQLLSRSLTCKHNGPRMARLLNTALVIFALPAILKSKTLHYRLIDLGVLLDNNLSLKF